MKSVMRYQRREPDICGGEPHLFMGRRTWSHAHANTRAHTDIAVCQTEELQVGFKCSPDAEQQVDRIIVLWCLPSPCVLFKESNMRCFLLHRNTDWGNCTFLCSGLKWSLA